MFVTVRENAFGENKVLEFCWGTYSEVLQGKLRVAVASEKQIYMWYLNLVVRRLRCINCLNSWANNCASLSPPPQPWLRAWSLCYREKNEVSDEILNGNFLHFCLYYGNFMHTEVAIRCSE